MGYDSSEGRITKPVSLDDIGQCLGVSSRDLGTLCESENIKFWAKAHPLRSSLKRELTENDRKAEAYGIILDITEWRTTSSLHIQNAFKAATASNPSYSWVYLKPRGIDYNEWYRILDFDGYFHGAECPIMFEHNDLTRGELNVYFAIKSGLDDGNITLGDLKNIGGSGLLITNNRNTRYGIIYSKDGGTPILAGGSIDEAAFDDDGKDREVTVNVADGIGEYKVVPIIINAINNMFATIPMKYKSFTVTNENVSNNKPILSGIYRADSTGAKTIIEGRVGANNVMLNAGYIEVFLCYTFIDDVSKLDNAVNAGNAVVITYSHPQILPNNSYAFGSTVNYNPNTIQIVWARVTTTNVGVTTEQFEFEDNSGDIM
jgi:hypothetical protein